MGETEKVNLLFPNIPSGNITEVDELIYVGAWLACDKIGTLLRNLNRNAKPGWEIRLERQVKKLWQQAKVLRKENHTGICKDEKTKTKSNDTPGRDKKKSRQKKRHSKDIATEASNINKTGYSKIKKENSTNK